MTDLTKPTLVDRVSDYVSALDTERRRKLAEFIGVQPQTVNQWHKKRSVPLGKRALQLHHLLVWVGFGDHQWREVNESANTLGKAVAFGIVPDEELLDAFKGEVDELSRIIQLLTGHKHISPACQKIIDDLAAVHSWDIKVAQDKWIELKINDEKELMIAELSNKLTQLLPLVQEMASDKWSDMDRFALRDRAGKSTVFELYTALGELCGERARQASVAERARAAAAAMLTRGQ